MSSGSLHVGARPTDARAAAIIVHGRTLDPEWMVKNLGSALGLDGLAYVLPRHPDRTWYPGRFDEPADALEPDLSAGLAAIDAALEALRGAGLPDADIAMIGFSQGACLVAEHLARRGWTPGAAAILTGSLIGPAGTETVPGPAMDGVRMLFTGAREDAWVPLVRMRSTADLFAAAGAQTTWAPHDDDEHHLNDADRDGVRALLDGLGR